MQNKKTSEYSEIFPYAVSTYVCSALIQSSINDWRQACVNPDLKGCLSCLCHPSAIYVCVCVTMCERVRERKSESFWLLVCSGRLRSRDGNRAGWGRRMGSSSLSRMVVALPYPHPASGCGENYLAPSPPLGAPRGPAPNTILYI